MPRTMHLGGKMLGRISIIIGLLAAGDLSAETGYDAWLRSAPLDAAIGHPYQSDLPAAITSLGNSSIVNNAKRELIRGI